PIDLTAEEVFENLVLLFTNQLGQVGALPSEFSVKVGKWNFALWIDEHALQAIEKVITRGPFDGPGRWDLLARLEDFLDHDPGVGRRLAKASKILLRVAKPIGMIDSHAINHAIFQPAQYEPMCIAEDIFVLHAQAHQRV